MTKNRKLQSRLLAHLLAFVLRSPWRVCAQCRQPFAGFEEGEFGTAMDYDRDYPTCCAESCQMGARRSQDARRSLLLAQIVGRGKRK